MTPANIGTTIVLSAALALSGCGAAIGIAVGGLAGLAASPGLHDHDAAASTPHRAVSGSGSAMASKAQSASMGGRAHQAAAGSPNEASQIAIRNIQRNLEALGYNPGQPDGVAGPRTRSSIRIYQETHHLPVDGEPTPQLAHRIDSEIERLTQLTRADAKTGSRNTPR